MCALMTSVLWGRRLSLREVEYLAQGHSWGSEIPPIQPHNLHPEQSVSNSLWLKSKEARVVSEEQYVGHSKRQILVVFWGTFRNVVFYLLTDFEL